MFKAYHVEWFREFLWERIYNSNEQNISTAYWVKTYALYRFLLWRRVGGIICVINWNYDINLDYDNVQFVI